MKATEPFSATQHMEAMFRLFMQAGAGRWLRQGQVGLNDLYAVWCAGFTEGMWTERAQKPPRRGTKADPTGTNVVRTIGT